MKKNYLKLFVFVWGFFILGFSVQARPKPAVQAMNKLAFTSEFVTVEELKQVLTKLNCAEYKIVTDLPLEGFVRKSKVVKEIYAILKSKRHFQVPLRAMVIQFRDIESDDPFFEIARDMRAIGIIDTTTGRFGTKKEKDPLISTTELMEMLGRAFQEKECEFKINEDRDKDGVIGDRDLCPNIPAKKTKDGCPIILFRPYMQNAKDEIKVTSFLSNINTKELTEIRLGDLFKIVFLKARTKEIIEESNIIEVKN